MSLCGKMSAPGTPDGERHLGVFVLLLQLFCKFQNVKVKCHFPKEFRNKAVRARQQHWPAPPSAVSDDRITIRAGPWGPRELSASLREGRGFWTFFPGFPQIILSSQPGPGGRAGPFQGHVHGSHQRAPSQGTARGARPHSSAVCWLDFSGNLNATHTFPFSVGRQDGSRSSEVRSALGLRPHQLPGSGRLQPGGCGRDGSGGV